MGDVIPPHFKGEDFKNQNQIYIRVCVESETSKSEPYFVPLLPDILLEEHQLKSSA